MAKQKPSRAPQTIPKPTPLSASASSARSSILSRAGFGWGALLFVCVVAVYAPALQGGFIWDDAAHVTPPDLRSGTGLFRTWFDLGATQQYYPILHSAFWFEHRLWGDAVFGYHLLNCLLHASAACLVALILRRLAIPGAWLAAFIFALHPVHAESVAWITEQKNTLSAVFYLSAALLYLHFDEKRRPVFYACGLGLFILALLTKSVTASLPAALLVLFWWKRGRLSWSQDVRPLLPWFVLGGGMGLFTAWVERTYNGASGADFELNVLQRLLVAGRVVWFYAGKLFWPTELAFIYPRWHIDPRAAWQYLFPLATLVTLAGLWLLRRRARAPLAAVLFFGGTLFPVLGVLNVYPFLFSFVADHFQYLASLGLITLTAAGLARLSAALPASARWVGAATTVGLCSALGVTTWRHSPMYRDAVTVYETTIARNPDCWMAHNNLGNIRRDQGQAEKAAYHFQQALRLKPDSFQSHYNLANVLFQARQVENAVVHYEQALKLRPEFVELRSNFGIALSQLGRVDQALVQLEEAVRLAPNFHGVHHNLGLVLESCGRPVEAVSRYERALQLKPDFTPARLNLGMILGKSGRMREAAAQFETAVQHDPNSASARFNLAATLRTMGRIEEARPHYRWARQLDPTLPRLPLD